MNLTIEQAAGLIECGAGWMCDKELDNVSYKDILVSRETEEVEFGNLSFKNRPMFPCQSGKELRALLNGKAISINGSPLELSKLNDKVSAIKVVDCHNMYFVKVNRGKMKWQQFVFFEGPRIQVEE